MRRFLLIALSALSLATPALAQGTGQSGISTGAALKNVKAFKELLGFGVCYARLQRADALKLIATTPDTAEERELFGKLVYGDRVTCMFGGDTMEFPIVYARGVMAEGLLRTGGVPDTLRMTAPPASEAKTLHDAARCYAVDHRAAAEKVLATEAGSANEIAAVAAVWTDFKTCMPGFNVRLNAPWIRFLLAEAVLRLPPAAVATGS